jgi:ribosomal protein S18 acetylase RimI-like enzyme
MPDSPLLIRRATNTDMDAMIAVVNAAFAIEIFLEGTRTDHDRMAEMMKKGEFLLTEEAGCVVSCVYTEIRGMRGYFGMLAVDPKHQGRGLGRKMIDAAEAHLRQAGCQHVDIAVLSLRPELPSLYRKLGYIQTATEEFRPSRPLKPGFKCHVIVMSKPL